MQCYGLIIIRHFFTACKKLAVYTDVYDLHLHVQDFMLANNNWMASRYWPAGRGLNALALNTWKTEPLLLLKQSLCRVFSTGIGLLGSGRKMASVSFTNALGLYAR